MLLKPSVALLRTQSDERLVALARDGSEAAFQALVERYRRLILGSCRRILPAARAEDAAQQVFVSAWRALNRGDDVHDVRPWLLRIARNTALNALRTQGYDYDELRDGLRVGDAPEAELERREVMRKTLAGLAALPERQREALLRSAVEGASHADIAKSLGLSEGATRQLVLRARQAMRSAATALTPWPLVTWVAQSAASTGGGAAGIERIAEIAAGGGAAGATAMLAKAGTVAVLAGGVIAGPAVIEDDRTADAESAKRRAPAVVETPAAAATPDAQPVTTVSAPTRPSAERRRGDGSGRRGEDRSDDRSGPSGSGRHRDDDDDRSGSDSGDSDDRAEDREDDHSGSGSSGSDDGDDGAEDHSGTGEDGGTSGGEDGGTSGSGSGDDHVDSGGEDASLDRSGSESSGSGESGSGTSGSSKTLETE